jgi:hypothetical protein
MSLKQDKPWEALKVSRATWYRYGKPTTPKPMTIAQWAKADGWSPRSAQRLQQRIRYVERLAPDLLREIMSGNLKASDAEQATAMRIILAREAVASALKLFEQERRNDVSAEAIADHLNQPVAVIVEALRLLQAEDKPE